MTEEKKPTKINGKENTQPEVASAVQPEVDPAAQPGALDWLLNGINKETAAAPQRMAKRETPAEETARAVAAPAVEKKTESVTAVQMKTEQPEAEAVEEPTKGISIRIPASLHRRIMNIKYSDGENLTALVIQALEEFVARKEVTLKKN